MKKIFLVLFLILIITCTTSKKDDESTGVNTGEVGNAINVEGSMAYLINNPNDAATPYIQPIANYTFKYQALSKDSFSLTYSNPVIACNNTIGKRAVITINKSTNTLLFEFLIYEDCNKYADYSGVFQIDPQVSCVYEGISAFVHSNDFACYKQIQSSSGLDTLIGIRCNKFAPETCLTSTYSDITVANPIRIVDFLLKFNNLPAL